MKALPDINERVVDTNGKFTEQTRLYLLELQNIVNNVTNIINAISAIVEISASDSPYTVVDKVVAIKVDASAGPVTINLMATEAGNYCNVIKGDASANYVTVASADGINGNPTATIAFQYQSDEYIGFSDEYNLR